MLQFFRNFFKSTLGVMLTLGFVGLIALAFAAGDVVSGGGFGGGGGGDNVATVGREKISSAQLSKQVTQAAEIARQDNPRMTLKDMLAMGGLEDVLGQVIDRTAMQIFGANHGIVASKRLVDSELAKLPQFQNPDGSFNDTAYRQMLAQRQLTDADVRSDISQGLIARQLLTPAQLGASMPSAVLMRYAQMVKEHRDGSIALLPSVAFAPKAQPSDAEVAAYYQLHQANYSQPERRVIRYATFTDAVIKQVAAPTDAEIAARYEAHKADYAASETRRVAQLILPTQAEAQAIQSEIAKGQSLDAAAKAKGLSIATIGPVARDAYAAQSSAEMANAAFSANKGALVGPVKMTLGYALLRVEAIDSKPARSLAQVRNDIATQLAGEKRRAALSALTDKIDDEFDKGGALSDAAKELGVTLGETPALTSDGQVFGKPGTTAPKELARVVQTAFSMERENQPQLAELDPGKSFVIFDVSQITPAAPAPLAEVKPHVIAAIMVEKGAAGARAAAMKVLASVKKGGGLKQAVSGLGVQLPPVQPVSMGREQIAAQQGHVPPPLALLFSMAQGTVKLLPAPQNAGWFVVQLKQIQPGTISAQDPLLATVGNEMNSLSGQEYAQELRDAIRDEVGVKRNETAIRAVSRQLVGN